MTTLWTFHVRPPQMILASANRPEVRILAVKELVNCQMIVVYQAVGRNSGTVNPTSTSSRTIVSFVSPEHHRFYFGSRLVCVRSKLTEVALTQ